MAENESPSPSSTTPEKASSSKLAAIVGASVLAAGALGLSFWSPDPAKAGVIADVAGKWIAVAVTAGTLITGLGRYLLERQAHEHKLALEKQAQDHRVVSERQAQEHGITKDYLDRALDAEKPFVLRQQFLRFLSTRGAFAEKLRSWAEAEVRKIDNAVGALEKAVEEKAVAMEAAKTPTELAKAQNAYRAAVARKNSATEATPRDPPITAAAIRAGFFTSASRDRIDLSGHDFADADLRDADLSYTTLKGTVFDRALCAGANFQGAVLQGSSFREARLTGASFYGADVRGATFVRAWLTSARFLNVGFACSRRLHAPKC